jgi:hypothetical protein
MRTATALIAAGLVMATAVCPANEVYWVPAHDMVPQDHSAAQLTSGDLDGDGDIDLSLPSYGPLRHYWNVGVPGSPLWAVDLGAYSGVSWCVNRGGTLGDIDADGDLDLVTTCYYDSDGKLHLFVNIGSSASPRWEESVGAFAGVPNHLGPLEPSLADIDADGDLDLFILNEFGCMILIENTGSPSAPAWSEVGCFCDLPINGAADLGDIDGDGDLDLVVMGGNSPVRCWENTGTSASFEFVENPGMLTGVDAPPGGSGVELLDIDADGDVDLLVSSLTVQANFLYLNQQIVAIEPTSWTCIKVLYR